MQITQGPNGTMIIGSTHEIEKFLEWQEKYLNKSLQETIDRVVCK